MYTAQHCSMNVSSHVMYLDCPLPSPPLPSPPLPSPPLPSPPLPSPPHSNESSLQAFEWLHNDEVVYSDVGSTGHYLIVGVSLSQAGSYACRGVLIGGNRTDPVSAGELVVLGERRSVCACVCSSGCHTVVSCGMEWHGVGGGVGLNKTATRRLTLFSEVRALAACTCSGAVLHRERQWTPHSPQTPGSNPARGSSFFIVKKWLSSGAVALLCLVSMTDC